MSLHQVRLRKDGPVHAIGFEKGQYEHKTVCGLPLSGLEKPKRLLFRPEAFGSCGRCSVSHRARAA